MTNLCKKTVTFLTEMVVMFLGLNPPKQPMTNWFEMVINL